MAKNKTTENTESVQLFLQSIANHARKTDAIALTQQLQNWTNLEPKMWGTSIIGFGSYHYVYASGHSGDAPLVSFAPRSNALVLYLASDFEDRTSLINSLGKIKAEKGCVYVKKLDDINLNILHEIVEKHIMFLKSNFNTNP